MNSVDYELEMPSEFNEDAKHIWNKLLPVMGVHGTWKADYEFSVVCACEAYADYRSARQKFYLDDCGEFTTAMGTANPTFRALMQSRAQFFGFLKDLGLTPVERSRLLGSQNNGGGFDNDGDDPYEIA